MNVFMDALGLGEKGDCPVAMESGKRRELVLERSAFPLFSSRNHGTTRLVQQQEAHCPLTGWCTVSPHRGRLAGANLNLGVLFCSQASGSKRERPAKLGGKGRRTGSCRDAEADRLLAPGRC